MLLPCGSSELSGQMLLNCETAIGTSLPQDYRSFLLKYNGGLYHDLDHVCFPVPGESESESVRILYGVGTDNGLAEAYHTDGTFFLQQMLPIGKDAAGNLLLLRICGNRPGGIYYWYRDENRICEVADNFAEFLGRVFVEYESYESLAEFAAIEKNEVQGIVRLLESGFDPNSRNEHQDTLLIVAAFRGRSEICRLLIEAGAEAPLKNKEGMDALCVAVRANCYDCTRLLVENDADVNAKDAAGVTPLMHSVICMNYRIAEYLVSKGADICCVSHAGDTALTLCHANPAMTRRIETMLRSIAVRG